MSDRSTPSRLREIFASVAFDAGRLVIDGVTPSAPEGLAEFSPALHRIAPQLSHLHAELYTRHYNRAAGELLVPREGPPLDKILSAANAGRAAWDTGWTISGMREDGVIVAIKGDTRCSFAPGHYLAAPAALSAPVAVFLPREDAVAQRGFYNVFSEALLDDRTATRLVRVYWNVEEAGAAPLVAAVTELLNRYRIPFRFKVVSRSGMFTRSDAAVLFFARRWFQPVARLLPQIRRQVRCWLREWTPLFTKVLYDGVGFAEDPALGDSFGLHRTRLLAAAIWTSPSGVEARMAKLEEIFAREGLSLAVPYLNHGSADWYDVVEGAA